MDHLGNLAQDHAEGWCLTFASTFTIETSAIYFVVSMLGEDIHNLTTDFHIMYASLVFACFSKGHGTERDLHDKRRATNKV